jgi:hypothetical protein
MKKTFWQINQQVLSEDAPMGGGMDMGGMGGPPGGMPSPGGPPGGGMGGPPIGGPPMGGGMGGPPMGGGMGLDAGMGGPPMGGPPPGDNANKQIELKPLDVWDVLNKILDGKKIKVEKQKKPIQPPPNNVQSDANPPQGMPNEAQPPGMNPPQGMPN